MNDLLSIVEKRGLPCGSVSFDSCLPLLPCKAIKRIPQQAQTVIMVGFPYLTKEAEHNISRYALMPDYHDVAREILDGICAELAESFPAYRFEAFVDSSPIREVDAAVRAGLGVLGKNGLLIHETYGSWLFLGSIVTDCPSVLTEREKRFCIDCGRCAKTCPTGCIGAQGVDAEHCLSAITQKKGELTPQEEELVRDGKLLWGCDRCQEVCPMNRAAEETPIAAFYKGRKPVLVPEDFTISKLRGRAYGFRGPTPLRRNWQLICEEEKS